MSQTQPHASDPCQLGHEAIRELGNMSIPPIPPFYEVWFSHLERNNHGLSLEIDKTISSGGEINEIFLKNIHGKYFIPSNAAVCIDDYASQLLNQTNNLKKLAENFDSSASEFHKDLDTASTQIRDESGASAEPSALLASLLKTAERAIERNRELEDNLSQATSRITSLQEAVELIATDANTDFLTKLSNRRYFDSALAQLIDAARLSGDPLCLIVADIDHFKKFNDTWGHQIGDQVLKLVAGTLRENVKGQDLIARYGGEEFAIAVPHTSVEDAYTLAENIRNAVSKRKLVNKVNNEELGRVTTSFGVALFEESLDGEAFFKNADSALYAAKEAGRNRVETFSSKP